ncbi:MAG: hypothetical protein C4529_01045 [Deltaproteobacteria bacterium]|nr:MAG: hypothetical protein C4529_01045 [Deltaproteobacteria bacterium]
MVRRATNVSRPRIMAVAGLLSIVAACPCSGREISGRQLFSGETVVPKGETWKVLPGAEIRFRGGKWTVRGNLHVEGTEARPVRIAGDEAFDGIDVRGEAGARVRYAVLSGGRRGIQVTNASAELRDVRFKNNGIGLDVGQYAKVRVERCVFEGNTRVGVLVKRGGAAEIAESRFSGAAKAGVYAYGADNVSLRDCRFERNGTGIQAGMAGARVRVVKSIFRGNGVGILAEKTASPEVSDSEVAANGTGFLFTRRAEGTVTGCRIEGNGTGARVEFSSYPVFRGNVFRGNRDAAVRLRHQSSEWEGEATEGDREGASGQGAPFGPGGGLRRDFRPWEGAGGAASKGGPPGKRGGLTGTVDFRGNDWGELQPQVDRGGIVTGIHDARVEPSFEYNGRMYRMDTVLLK